MNKKLSTLSLKDMKDGMYVVYTGDDDSVAKRGATATVDIAKCGNHFVSVVWHDDIFRYLDLDNYNKAMKFNRDELHPRPPSDISGQEDGSYHYHSFWPVGSPEGQAILQEIGKVVFLGGQTMTGLPCKKVSFSQEIKSRNYCLCSSPDTVENVALGNSFLFCRICKKERL